MYLIFFWIAIGVNRMAPNILLKMERDKRGWSQKEVADEVKASEASYHRWESQGVLPTPYYRQELARLFGKTIEELGLLPSQSSQSSGILSQDADLDLVEIHQALNTNVFLQFCSLMSEPNHEHRSEKYAVIIEE